MIVSISICICGCVANNYVEVESTMATEGAKYNNFGEKIATKDFLVNTMGFLEIEFEGLDVEAILAKGEIAELALLEAGKDHVISILKKNQEIMNAPESTLDSNNYSYLVESGKFTGKYPAFDDLKYFTYSDHVGTGGSSFFIDYEKNTIRFATGGTGIYENIEYYSTEEEMTLEMKSKMINALHETGVINWKNQNYAKSRGSGLDSYWYLGMEFTDGTVISYTGRNNFKETVSKIEDALYN